MSDYSKAKREYDAIVAREREEARMTDHLPECLEIDPSESEACICTELRACEARVMHELACGKSKPREECECYFAGLDAARKAVAALPWKVAVSFGPIDCDESCEHGPCTCSGVMRPEAWMTGPADVRAAIDALRGGQS